MVQSNVSVNSAETVKIISEETDHKLKAQFKYMATLLGLVGEDLEKALQSDHGLQLIAKNAVSAIATRRASLREAHFNQTIGHLSVFLSSKVENFRQFKNRWESDAMLRDNVPEPKVVTVKVSDIPLPPNVDREGLDQVLRALETKKFFRLIRRNVQVSKDSKSQIEVYLELDAEHMVKYETDQLVSE